RPVQVDPRISNPDSGLPLPEMAIGVPLAERPVGLIPFSDTPFGGRVIPFSDVPFGGSVIALASPSTLCVTTPSPSDEAVSFATQLPRNHMDARRANVRD